MRRRSVSATLASLPLLLRSLALGLLGGSILPRAATRAAGDAFRHGFTAIEGHPLPLQQFRGRPVLVVNTASLCGFTRQYAELQSLWDRYRERGLVVLGVPSASFRQELDDNAAIQEFCEVNFGIDFPLTEQVEVLGPTSHPLFAQIREELGSEAGPGWNFYKYLIAPDGRIVQGWRSQVSPTDAAVTGVIERYLAPAS